MCENDVYPTIEQLKKQLEYQGSNGRKLHDYIENLEFHISDLEDYIKDLKKQLKN